MNYSPYKISFLFILLLIVFIGFNKIYAGETGKIAGKVTDKQTGEALVGANIVITARIVNGSEQNLVHLMGAATDVNGDYYILNIPPGLYVVKASFVGYNTEIVKEVQIEVDKTTHVDFKLSSKAYQTENVVVTAYSPQRLEPDLTATKQVYNTRDIQSMPGVANLSDILELQADVIDNHFRGGREGESLYLIGGATINNPLTNRRTFSPIVSGLQEVEVYTSGFSAEYGNAQSGVVNMITKEGGEKWETSLEVSGTMPYYKTFHGSVYSPSNLYFYSILKNTEAWLAENPTQPGRPLWDAGYGFGGIYLPPRDVWPPNPLTVKDSLHIARLGQISWLEAMRDIGLQYNNTVDYRVDFSVGGPLAKNLKFFMAGRQTVSNPIVPTTHPDIEREAISSLVFQPSLNDKFTMRYIYDNQFDNSIGSNWLQWMFDRTLSITQSLQTTNQYGLDWTHIFNPSTFMNLKLNLLSVYARDNIELLTGDQYIYDYQSTINWTNYVGPSDHSVGRLNNDRGGDITTTYNLNGNITSQLNKWNMVKSGLQFSYYDLNVNRDMNISDAGSYRKIKFEAFPYEGALYVQDKMEFEGFVANVGIRYDFYNFNTSYYSDIYSPLRNPNYNPNLPYLERGQYYDASLAAKERTKLYTRLQPRIGISFPVSVSSVFHLNYGTFTQRPTFDEIFWNQVTTYNQIEILGNPRLKPENTQAYDIGLENSFPLGIKLDVSAYYKDVSNLVETAYYYDMQQQVYATYKNRDYADIKGFHVNLEKSAGAFRGYIRYNYEVATGKSSNDLNAPVTYFENPAEGAPAVVLPAAQDVYLDYDRTHKAVLNLSYRTFNKEGFKLLGIYPLENIIVSATFRIYTGRPFTWDESGQGLQFNRRTPTEKDLRIRIQKRIRTGSGDLTVYAEGYNLTNEEVFNYSRTFPNPGSNSSNIHNTATFVDDRANVLVYDLYPPYYTDQAVNLLSNQPRHFRFGIIYKF